MSELSEAIKTATEKVARAEGYGPKDEGPFVDIRDSTAVADIPGFDAAKMYHEEMAARAVRRVYRMHVGARPFESPNDAVNRTWPDMMPLAEGVCMGALADGVLIGQGNSAVYKKHEFMGKLDELIINPSFRSEALGYALQVAGDEDARALIRKYIADCLNAVGQASTYSRASSATGLNKIWDVWLLCLNSSVLGLFHVGYRMGKAWAEDDVLNGILSVSTDE